MLTGEPVPVEVGEGATVAGATINISGRLVVEATKVGGDTALAQIARLVADAQTGKAPIQRLVDRVSAVFVPIVIALSLATLVGWLLLARATRRRHSLPAVAVLIIACPCALGDETGDLGQRRVATDPRRLDDEPAGSVDRAAHDRRPFPDLDGNGLTRSTSTGRLPRRRRRPLRR